MEVFKDISLPDTPLIFSIHTRSSPPHKKIPFPLWQSPLSLHSLLHCFLLYYLPAACFFMHLSLPASHSSSSFQVIFFWQKFLCLFLLKSGMDSLWVLQKQFHLSIPSTSFCMDLIPEPLDHTNTWAAKKRKASEFLICTDTALVSKWRQPASKMISKIMRQEHVMLTFSCDGLINCREANGPTLLPRTAMRLSGAVFWDFPLTPHKVRTEQEQKAERKHFKQHGRKKQRAAARQMWPTEKKHLGERLTKTDQND